MMRSYLILAVICLVIHNTLGQSGSKFSKNKIIEDLDYLYESLEATHYNLYAYTAKQEIDAAYQNLKNSVTADSLSLLEATSLFQQLISKVNNGHTEIDFPAQSYIEYAHSGGKVFPLEIAFEDDKYFIRKNWSNNSEIHVGDEIVSINGTEMSHVMARIFPQISAERPYFKKAKIEMYSFPRLYWQVFGRQDEFVVRTGSNQSINSYRISAIDLIEGYETKRTEVLNSKMKLDFKDNVAYLNPGDFGGDEDKYRKFIDSSFVELKGKNSKVLIIDLRNNTGGDDSFSDYLVSYIANKPFKWNSRFTLKTSKLLKEQTRKNMDTTTRYAQEILNRKDGEIFEFTFNEYKPQPIHKRFVGKVYVLINRQSHSQSAVTAAQIQDYEFGTTVGEETGDYPSLYASQFQYNLPNTGITVKISKGFIERVSGNIEDKGVVPDIFIKDHLLDEKDEILEGLLKLLRK